MISIDLDDGVKERFVMATTNIGATANDIEQLIAAVRTKMDTLTSDEDKEAASESLEVIEAEVKTVKESEVLQ